ncbi:SMI1/KNR4 family protein [Streptomyces virginiae]|uniref:SMI1/KNR4 family protein n=1 Tax=Streptomyces virginiae TaxID=1961 RepID=UPI00068ADABB|nr:SMI1/KNR4 family protein [Streptomyces virginiae]MCX4720331.1 SMI1/KNR4 family protein [Streptomyces virginiae]MCX5270747.1 SMI1/KNR4 family protein [Streptomyces virginiae]
MEDPTGIAALARILPPDLGTDEEIDRAAAEARWGTRLPQDYMAFMSMWGAGSFDGVSILMPLPKEYVQWDPGTFEEETENARDTWEMLGGQQGLDIDPDDILAWGVTSGADILCWLTTDPDPDRWPVLVCGRHTREDFTLFSCGMVEFLRKLLLNEFDPYPISIGLGDAPPRYVHWLLQQRRWKAGLDRYSGEPRPANH